MTAMELRSAAFALALAFVFGEPAVAQELPTDANIVTGIDISDSVSPADARLEIEALALAIRSPEVLGAIARGRHGRIGFAVFAWHHTLRPQVVAWTIIAGEEDARAAARAIEARLTVDIDLEAREDAAYFMGRLTNLSRAIDHARALLAAAPFSAERDVVNIIGNGADNIDEDAGVARDRLVHAGGTVNGVVLGEDGDVLAYYREEVIGGPGAFLMSLRDAAAFADVMRRKFVLDIVLSAPPAAVLAALPAE